MHSTVDVINRVKKEVIVFRAGPWTMFSYLVKIILPPATVYMKLEEIFPVLF